MVYERETEDKTTGDSLDSYVQNLSKLFKNQITIRNADDEQRFNKAVLEENLTLDDQLEFRKEQLKRATDDPEERRRLRFEVSNLKQRIEQEVFTDAYVAKLTEFQGGVSSVDSLIDFLDQQEAATSNETVKNLISQKKADAANQKFTLTQSFIDNQVDYATNSKSVALIDAQISRVASYRADALLSNNQQLVSVYDLQIQSLQQSKTAVQVQQDVLNLGALTATGSFSAIAMLDVLNDKISSASSSGPVKVGDTTFANIRDFWTFKRDGYLNDQSSSGFFPELSGELKTDINTVYSKNSLSVSGIAKAGEVLAKLAVRPEMAAYQKQIDIYKQDVLQSGADLILKQVEQEFAQDLDVNVAVSNLSAIKSKLGVNVDDSYIKILQSNAATKSQQVANVLSAASQAMQNDPNLTPELAVQQAVAAGSGTVVSPRQAATESEGALATKAVATAAAEQGVNDPRTTIAPGESPVTPQASGNLPSATIAALPNLTPGTQGNDVRTLQNFLIQQGFSIPDGATGLYGPQTQAAVAAFQDKNKIDTAGNPGYFGPRTKAFLSGKSPTATTTAPAPVKPTAAPAPLPVPASTPAPQASTTTQKTAASTPVPAPAPATMANTPKPTTTQASSSTQASTPAKAASTTPAKTSTPVPAKTVYQGTSIVDYLKSVSKDSSMSSRAKLAAQKGIKNYTGTAAQNTQLLKSLRGF